tara:strand:+ start:1048 stop:1260 length:213 start_codon:yes stop_codon:yes gene_type:complete
MKFVLVISVCSFLTGECKPPVKFNHIYNSWAECAAAAQLNGLTLLQAEGINNVNKYRLGVKYSCKERFAI